MVTERVDEIVPDEYSVMKLQFLCEKLPDGKLLFKTLEVTRLSRLGADILINAGYLFEIKILRAGELLLSCIDKDKKDVAVELVKKGYSVVFAVQKLVLNALEAKDGIQR